MRQRHAADTVSLVFAIVFGGFALVWLLNVTGQLDGHDVWWTGPAVLVVAGVAGLATSLRPDGERDRSDGSLPEG